MKIEREMFKSFKGLGKLKKIQKEGYCNSMSCSKCPLNNSNIKIDMVECSDIIALSSYRAKDSKSIKTMNKLIDIFTKENINSILAKLAPNRKLKYNDYVIYNNRAFRIKGVLKASAGLYNPILLSGYDADFSPEYESCIVDKDTIKKEYTLWVNPSEIFALNDIVTKIGSTVEYKIVAIDKSQCPILLDDHSGYYSISECAEEILCSIPEAYEKGYNTWVSSDAIKHK